MHTFSDHIEYNAGQVYIYPCHVALSHNQNTSVSSICIPKAIVQQLKINHLFKQNNINFIGHEDSLLIYLDILGQSRE